MELTSNVTLIILVVTVLLSRYINSEAIKKLPMEKKAELLDGFSTFGVWSMLPLFALIGGFYFLTDYIESNHLLYVSIFSILALLYVFGIQVYIYKKLKKMEYPLSYIKQYLLSVFIRFLGVFILVYPLVGIYLT